MIPDFTYAVIGTGALGGFYGAKLQKAGVEVHFLLRSDYEQVRQNGLIVESILGDFMLPDVNAYQNAAKMPACDVVIVSLKTTHNYLLPQLLPNLVKDNGVVLVLQNGLDVEAEIASIVGAEKVMGGLCFLCANKIALGHIRHLDYGQIKLAEYAVDYQPVGITGRMRQIAADFERAGIKIDLGTDLLLARWQKLVWNIPYNGLSVVLDARTDELMANPATRALVEDLMAEVVAGAAACDRTIPPSFVTQMLDYTQNMKPYRTSMKIDYDEKRPMEIETMFGNTLRLAEKYGKNLPKIAMLYQQLKFLNSKN
jgi:2-dehydropantoate 2-reductase